MKKTRRLLQMLFVAPLIMAALTALLFETDVILPGDMAGRAQAEFLAAATMELLTVCLIPLALRMFKFKKVAERLKTDRLKALRRYGAIRIALLGALVVANTLLYYLFMNTTFGYMAIIAVISMAFVFPSADKCDYETLGDNSEL